MNSRSKSGLRTPRVSDHWRGKIMPTNSMDMEGSGGGSELIVDLGQQSAARHGLQKGVGGTGQAADEVQFVGQVQDAQRGAPLRLAVVQGKVEVVFVGDLYRLAQVQVPTAGPPARELGSEARIEAIVDVAAGGVLGNLYRVIAPGGPLVEAVVIAEHRPVVGD